MKYETDMVGWAEAQAEYIKAAQFDKLDLVHLVEEVRSIAKQERRYFTEQIIHLMAALLTWQIKKNEQSDFSVISIENLRLELEDVLTQSPSLKESFKNTTWVCGMWERSILRAQIKTGLPERFFPRHCEWSFNEVLKRGWLPPQSTIAHHDWL